MKSLVLRRIKNKKNINPEKKHLCHVQGKYWFISNPIINNNNIYFIDEETKQLFLFENIYRIFIIFKKEFKKKEGV